jgi:UDP-2,4-diacetamido-2,4,6-trideoxy-beta-L-altropyranose hydrolase
VKVAIRTDASLVIGTGHVMRCKTLADELRDKGAEIHFICREHPGHLIHLLRNAGYITVALPEIDKKDDASRTASDNYVAWLAREQSQDARQTMEALSDFKPDWLVIDHYGIDITWERLLRPYIGNILVIDDLANRPHDCELLLDQNLYLGMEKRYSGLVPSTTRQLLGPRYALLRPEFRKARKTLRERDGIVRRILIFFGGVDPTGETEKSLLALQQLELTNISVKVVVGSNNPRTEIIQEKCSAIPYVSFHQQVSNMAELMEESDLALGAGGSTTWERCALGLPCLTIIVADNQRKSMLELMERGAIFLIESSEDASPERIALLLKRIIYNRTMLQEVGRKALAVFARADEKENELQDGWPGIRYMNETARI